MRKTFAEITYELQKQDDNLVVLLGDIGIYGFRKSFDDFPSRTINLGIMEQTMIGVAAGMAMSGKIPIVHTIAPFMIERAYEQIKIDFGYQELQGNLVSVGASFDYAALGSTHHCPGDIPLLSQIPGMQIVIPGTAEEFKAIFQENYKNGRCTYYRLSEGQNSNSHTFQLGKGSKIRNGEDLTIIVIGPILDLVIMAAKDFDAEIIYLSSINPLDEDLITSSCKSSKVLIVEPYYSGSIAIKLIKLFSGRQIKTEMVGIECQFPSNYGITQELYSQLGLSVSSIRAKIERLVGV
jgi:transketolase